MALKPGVNELLMKDEVYLNEERLVCWKDNATEHPRNWRVLTKLYTIVVVTWLEFFMTAISSAGASTADAAMKEYRISSTLAYFAFLTIYLLGQTIGAIFCSPISEVFGRRTIYLIGSLLFCVASVVVAAPRNSIAVYLGRFFQGVAAAIPATVAFGNFSDMYDASKRVWVVYFYTITGIAGLSIGPIFATYLTMTVGWRWVYYISAIVMGASAVGCLLIRESNANQLLQVRVRRIREQSGQDDLKADVPDGHLTIASFVKYNLLRPLHFLITQPIVFFCAALCAIAFALIYGLTEALSIVYTLPPFDRTFDETSSSLSFIAIFIGQILNVLPRIYDDRLLKSYRMRKLRIVPETKIHSLVTSCPALAIGLWIFAWTIPPVVTNVPWAISMIGLIGVGYAANDLSYVLFGYATDAYGFHAASAVSAVSLTRTIAAGIVPLFTTQMYRGLGSNKATTIWAAIATAFCITPWLFIRYGRTLREKSTWAVKGDRVLSAENEHMQDEYEDGDDDNDDGENHDEDHDLEKAPRQCSSGNGVLSSTDKGSGGHRLESGWQQSESGISGTVHSYRDELLDKNLPQSSSPSTRTRAPHPTICDSYTASQQPEVNAAAAAFVVEKSEATQHVNRDRHSNASDTTAETNFNATSRLTFYSRVTSAV